MRHFRRARIPFDRRWVRAAVSWIQDAFRRFDPRSFDRVRVCSCQRIVRLRACLAPFCSSPWRTRLSASVPWRAPGTGLAADGSRSPPLRASSGQRPLGRCSRAAEQSRPRQGFRVRPTALPRLVSVRLSAPLDAAEKVLLTDFCNQRTARAPVDRPIPELRGSRRDGPPSSALALATLSSLEIDERGERRRTALRRSDPR